MIGSIGREEKIPASAAARFWCLKVGAVTLNVKDRSAAPKTHSGIWMGDGIVEDLGEGVKSFLCSFCLKGRHIAKCDHNCVVYSDGVMKESSNDGLDVGDVQGREYRSVVLGVGKLLLGAIDRLLPFVVCIL